MGRSGRGADGTHCHSGRWSRPLLAWVCLAVAAGGLAACSSGQEAPSTSSSVPGSSVPGSSVPGTPATAPGSTTTTEPPPVVTPGPPGGPVPDGFAAASVTFVSLQTGWVLGTAPCSAPPCTSVVRTTDGGRTWVGIPAPKVGLSVDLGPGVRGIRFADADNGWAFGPDLWTTHDGGAHWDQTTLPGVDTSAEVSDLAAAAGVVHAAVLESGGQVRILTSPVGTDAWVASPTTVSIGAGPVPFAQVVLQGSRGWLIEVDRTVIGGARLSGGAWVAWDPPCLDAGGRAFLAAPTATDLVAVCDEGDWNDRPRAVRAYLSSDGGSTFSPTALALPLQGAVAVASGRPGTAVVPGAGDVVATFDSGATWSTVAPADVSRSWLDLGFTSPSQGVAVAVQPGSGVGPLLMTLDGGHTWSVVPIR